MLSTGIDVQDLKYVVLVPPDRLDGRVQADHRPRHASLPRRTTSTPSRSWTTSGRRSSSPIQASTVSRCASGPSASTSPGRSSRATPGTSPPRCRSLGEPEPDFDRTQSEGRTRPAASAEVLRRRHRSHGHRRGLLRRRHQHGRLRPGGVRATTSPARSASLCPTIDDLRARWADPQLRAVLEEGLASRGVSIEEMSRRLELATDTDPFDVLAHAAWNIPQRTRAERARLVREDHASDLEALVPTAREIIAPSSTATRSTASRR